MTAGVYRIRNRVTGVAYIGSSVNIEHRAKGHQRRLTRGNHENRSLQAAWDEYGATAFAFGILEVTGTPDDALEEAERRWATRYAGQLYNARPRPTRARPDSVTLLHRGIGAQEDVRRARAMRAFWAKDWAQRRASRRRKASR